MSRLLLKVGALALQVILLPPLFAQVQETDIKAAKKTEEEARPEDWLLRTPKFNPNP